jgi:signal transduction histidine kinase
MTEPTTPRPFPRPVAGLLWLLFGATIAAGIADALPMISADTGTTIGYFMYPLASAGAAIFLIASASRCRGRERWAWVVLGLGIACWALGECIWQGYLIGGIEVPYPGVADIAYILGYPLMTLGVLLLPHVRSGRYERLRLLLDASAGTVAISIVMWVAYLNRVVGWDAGAGFLANTINAFYPAGDVILLLAVMVLALRRSEYRFDPRLIAVALALVGTAAADIIYYVQADDGTYIDGSWVDALWLAGYAAYYVAAWLNTRARPAAETAYGAARWWQLLAPYGAVTALFIVTLVNIDGTDTLLNWASILVGGLIIARQGVAIRENRELVEKQRDDLVASVSHELRTPLTAVQGYAQLLAEDWSVLDDEERHRIVALVEGQAGHLGRIVADLVEAARDRLHSVELRSEDAPLDGVISQVLAALSPAAQEMVTTDAAPAVMVHADLSRLRQVLLNLLNNAFRYGRSRILLAVREVDGWARFQVHDNGPGIPKKYESAIWERFERGAHRYDSRTPGSGIGLPIARALVEAHGGTIHQHRSEVLGGACFEFTIPLATPVADSAPGPAGSPVPALASAGAQPPR